MAENGGRSEGLLESAEGCICLDRPGKLDSLSGQGGEGSSKGRVMKYEFSVEISKSQKRLNFFDRLRDRPVEDS